MTNTTRHALPLPVTLLIAWAVGIAVFLALRSAGSRAGGVRGGWC